MDLIVDISNYQGAISPALVACWGQHGVRRVIPQAVNPPPGFAAGQTREQLQACKDAGMPTDCYVFFWTQQSPAVAVEAKSLADGFDIGYWFADFEDDSVPGSVLPQIRAFVNATQPDGIYTRRDWWENHAENTDEFSHLILWDADWNLNPSGVGNFRPYGGWTSRAIQQYGSGSLCGVSGLDMNVINEEVFVPPSQQYVGDDYWGKFGPDGNNTLANRFDWSGVAANLEGIIGQVMQQTQAPDSACEEKLAQIKSVLGVQP